MQKSAAIFAKNCATVGNSARVGKIVVFIRMIILTVLNLPDQRFYCVKIAALFHAIKSAICSFLSRFAELFNCAFLLFFLEIADFIFDRPACGYYPIFIGIAERIPPSRRT